MELFRFITLILVLVLPISLSAQIGDITAVDDTICIQLGAVNNDINVTDNDIILGGFTPPIELISNNSGECLSLSQNGEISYLDNEYCCGNYELRYRYLDCEGAECMATAFVTIKCPKPDCFLVNLDDFQAADGPGGLEESCIYACEFSEASYFVGYDGSSTYSWTVVGGTSSPGSNPAEIDVSWGAQGTGNVTLIVTDTNGVQEIISICVEILKSPIAAFTASDTAICLNSSVSFTNNSIGGSTFFWDFGDGNSSTMFSPNHQYTTPGYYSVVLYVTNNNYDNIGNPLCCCTDSTTLDIYVDSTQGPDIYWISTLCANDSSKYWTDATNCSSYIWSVFDANGDTVSFYGQGNDTICVVWGDGPFGTIQLSALGCDSSYCPFPTTATVPIIHPNIGIAGVTTVCENETQTYTVPKWISVLYNWTVSGGTIVSGQGTNTVTIHWGTAPGPGTINLNYYSTFLSGLPGQQPLDCEGNSALSVDIKPEFEIIGPFPSVVCLNTNSNIFATSTTAGYTWSISPSTPFTGQGTSIISPTWSTGAGTFLVSAVPNDSTVFCNDHASTVVTVVSIGLPDSLSGPTEICPNSTATYFGYTSDPNTGFTWTVTGGSPSSYTGNPLTVNWGPTGPYEVALEQFLLSSPFCKSDTIALSVKEKQLTGPLTIAGPSPCTNIIQNYTSSPAQHLDATYTWSVTPATAGSIYSGQGTPGVAIQWNNAAVTATVQLTVALCDSSITDSVLLNIIDPAQAVITMTGNLCPGGSAILDGGSGFASYAWSTGSTTQTTVITAGGNYTLTTTNANGCQAIAAFTAVASPGPVADISTPDLTSYCIDTVGTSTDTVTLYAVTSTGYTYQWFCNNVLQANTTPIFAHPVTNTPGTFSYWAKVTNQDNCFSYSDTITVFQNICPGDSGCVPMAYTLNFTVTNQTPNCNIVDFATSNSTLVTLTGWQFGEPGNNTNIGTLSNATHQYNKAGYYLATLFGVVPAANGTDTCVVDVKHSVCIPIAADFEFNDSCQQVCFTDLSTYLPGRNATSWLWNFGDLNNSSLQHPCHTYNLPGTYTVTLTVMDALGCSSTISHNVTVAGPPVPTVTIAPNPACIGDSINFNATGSGIINWLWVFGDSSSNGGQNPIHTYSDSGIYVIQLKVADTTGCSNTIFDTVVIHPNPVGDSITYAPSLTICAGDSVTLTAPAGTGYQYLWTNGATSQSIVVYTNGTFGLTITDANGCRLVLDPVEVIVYPKPVAVISGDLYICDSSCIALTATAGFGYTYQWLDHTGTPIPFQTFQTISVCYNNLLPGYAVEITDNNGCKATSNTVVVSLAISPSFSVSIAPDSCAGSLTTLTVIPLQSNVVYSWSDGNTGPVTQVIQAGTYTVIGRDTITGCSSSASATIHPLPDLCIVPVGCYEACIPDTICGPPGLAVYQWNMNGSPLTGENSQCLIVTQSGTYSLTGTNSFGCSLTSEDLILELIDCDSIPCDLIEITAKPANEEGDSCCWSLSYSNQYGDLYGLMISTVDADLTFDLAGLNPSLAVQTIGTNYLGLQNSSIGNPIPAGFLSDFVTFCMTNIVNSPQMVIVDWYDSTYQVVCRDTLLFDCPVEPDCPYVSEDSIYCEDGQIIYSATICNPIDAGFNIGYFQLNPLSPSGIVLTPSSYNLSANPILPGGCATFTFTLSGSGIERDTFCYQLTAHDVDPAQVDTALCCTLDTTYCIPIPDCNPCDDVGVRFVDTLSTEDCCYDIHLFNFYSANYFDGVNLCLVSPNTTMTINNPFGSGWSTVNYSPTAIELDVISPIGQFVPIGVFQLPQICLQSDEGSQLLEIKWMIGDSIVCRDTIELFCEPNCGFVFEEEVICQEDGSWVYNGLLKNTSGFTMDNAHFIFTAPPGMNIYNQTLALGGLNSGSTFPFNINIGAPAVAGDTVCFTVALHEENHDSLHLNCCNFHDCIVLPECDSTTTGIQDSYNLRIYPVPCTDYLILEGQNLPPGGLPMRIIGLNGHVCETTIIRNGVHRIQTSRLSPGYYILNIQHQNVGFVKQ